VSKLSARHISWFLLASQALFVLLLLAGSDRPVPFEFSRPMGAAMMLWTVGVWIIIIRVLVRSLRAERPVFALVPLAKSELPIVVRALEWAAILGLAMAIHGWAKSSMPFVTGYWADTLLADVDHAIFGSDPWRLFRSDLLKPLYAQAYVSWFPITFGTMAVLAFSRKDHRALFNGYLITLIVGGTMGEHLLPSAGPIFYERLGLGTRFQELVATNDPTYSLFADYLWKYYQAGGAGLGTGISAMPSMHVALAVWTLFAAHRIWKPLSLPAAAYVAIIWGASIASGWHYATDGVAGALIACAAQWAVTRQWRKPAPAAISVAEPVPGAAPAC
jgi:hypothetical protein